MANHIPNGGRNAALPDENQPTWRPQDDEPSREFRRGDERDERGWRAHRRDDERERGWSPRRPDDDRAGARGGRWPSHGDAGVSDYGEDLAWSPGRYTRGAHADDRQYERSGGWRDEAAPPSGFEDRTRGRGGSWQDRSEFEGRGGSSSYRGRDLGPERRELSGDRDERTGYHGAYRSGDERMGYAAGSFSHQDAPRPGTGQVRRDVGPHRGKGPSGYQRSDERIRELVCEALTDDDQVDATRIEVTVKNGEVTLSGSVDDRRAKRDAEDCACSVTGVRDVHNQLRVQPDDGRSNRSGASTVGSSAEAASTERKHRS